MTKSFTNKDDRMSLFLSLIYLKSEAKLKQMTKTEKQLDLALKDAMHDMQNSPSLLKDASLVYEFVEKALLLNKEELRSMVRLIEHFGYSLEIESIAIENLNNKKKSGYIN